MWTAETHHTFPDGARARAVELLKLGVCLAREDRFKHHHQLMEAWVSHVIPRVVVRCEH